MTSTTPEPARVATTPAKGASKTAYVILRRTTPAAETPDPAGGLWQLEGERMAVSGDAAIRAFVDTAEDAPGHAFVAVPARSFQPRVVRVETSTKVTLG